MLRASNWLEEEEGGGIVQVLRDLRPEAETPLFPIRYGDTVGS